MNYLLCYEHNKKSYIILQSPSPGSEKGALLGQVLRCNRNRKIEDLSWG